MTWFLSCNGHTCEKARIRAGSQPNINSPMLIERLALSRIDFTNNYGSRARLCINISHATYTLQLYVTIPHYRECGNYLSMTRKIKCYNFKPAPFVLPFLNRRIVAVYRVIISFAYILFLYANINKSYNINVAFIVDNPLKGL